MLDTRWQTCTEHVPVTTFWLKNKVFALKNPIVVVMFPLRKDFSVRDHEVKWKWILLYKRQKSTQNLYSFWMRGICEKALTFTRKDTWKSANDIRLYTELYRQRSQRTTDTKWVRPAVSRWLLKACMRMHETLVCVGYWIRRRQLISVVLQTEKCNVRRWSVELGAIISLHVKNV